jgi:hypothetical protein
MGQVSTNATSFERGGVPTQGNRLMAAQATTVDGDLAVTTAIAATPRSDSNVKVEVNGVNASVGDGVKVGVECYFSGDGGVTPRTISNIQAGDQLYWNGSVAGYQLVSADRITFRYDV